MSFMQRETILKSNTGNFQDSVPVKLIKADNTLKIIFENENSVLTEPNMTLCVFLQNKSFVERQLAPGAGQLIMSPFSWPLDGVIGLAVIQGEPSGCRFVLRGNLGREINWPDLIFFYQAKHQKKKQNQPSKQEPIQKDDTAGQKAPVMDSDHANNSTPPAKTAVKPSHQPSETAEKPATAAKSADQPSQQVSSQSHFPASSGNIPSPKNDGTRQSSSPAGNISGTSYMASSPHPEVHKYQVNDSTITQNQNRKDSSRENQSLDQKGQDTLRPMAQKDPNSVESPKIQSSPSSLTPQNPSFSQTGSQNKSYTRSTGKPTKKADSPLPDSAQQPVVHHRDVLAQRNRQHPVNSPNHRGVLRNDAKSNRQAFTDGNPPTEQTSRKTDLDGQPREKGAESSTAASYPQSPNNNGAPVKRQLDTSLPTSKQQYESSSAVQQETPAKSTARPATQARDASSQNSVGKHREITPSTDSIRRQSMRTSTVRQESDSRSSHAPAQQGDAPCLQEDRQIIVAEPFSHIFPNAHWYKVTYPLSRGKWHYLLGEIYHNNKMVLKAIAVPGKYSMSSPSWLKGFDTFFISKENQAGYWLLFEDAQTGHIVYDYKSYFTSG